MFMLNSQIHSYQTRHLDDFHIISLVFTHQNPLIVFLSKVQSIGTPLTIILKNARVLICFRKKQNNYLLEKYND